MLKFGDWVNRKRHNRGFGIQSPSAFFFITQVLKEKLPYYSYRDIDKAAEEYGRRAHTIDCRELFRITNYLHPHNCIAVGAPLAACAMATARPRTKQLLITEGEDIPPHTKSTLGRCGCRELAGNAQELLVQAAEELGKIGMLFVGSDKACDTLLQKALEHTNSKSVIIVEGIHRNQDTLSCWNSLVADNRTVITYDMYSYGMLFFDKERKKQHYKLKR